MLRAACVLTIAAAMGLTAPAAAAVHPSESDKATARHLVAVGDEQFARGDYPAALDAYRGADEIMHVPTTSILVAKTLVVLGRLREAEKLVTSFEDDVDRAEPAPFTAARAQARALHHELNERIPQLTLVVEPSAVDGTLVTLDGRPVAAGKPLRVDPGLYHVEVTAPDGRRAERDVRIGEGRDERVSITLPAARPLEAPAAGDSGVGEALAWTGLAIVGAGAVVGGVFGGLSMKRVSDAEARCPTKRMCDAETQDRIDESTTFAHVSTAGFIAAGVGAGLALTGLGLTLSSDDGRDLTARVSLSSFGLAGTF